MRGERESEDTEGKRKDKGREKWRKRGDEGKCEGRDVKGRGWEERQEKWDTKGDRWKGMR